MSIQSSRFKQFTIRKRQALPKKNKWKQNIEALSVDDHVFATKLT
jgi:hypothetical protein